MASSLDVDQALHARAGWRKAVLIPLWTVQIFLLLCSMGIFAYRLAETLEHYEERNQLGEVPIVEVVWQAANVGFNLVALILTIVEIARLATDRLTPWTMVFTNAIKLTLALAMLALDIVARIQDMDGEWSIVGLPLDVAFLVAALGTAIYGFTTYRRLAKYDDYLVTDNANASASVKPYPSYHAADNSLELGGAPYSNPVPRTGVHPYASYSDADYSSSSYPSQTQRSTVAPGSNYPEPSHPTAGLTLKQQADRAMGHEFGWDTATTIPMTPPTPNLHPNPNTTTTTISGPANTSTTGNTHGSNTDIEGNNSSHRSGSVVLAAGTVHVHRGVAVVANSPTAGPGPGQLHGQRSWVTERGVIAEGDEYEEDEEDQDGVGEGRQWADAGGGHGMSHGVVGGGEEDREALLGREGR